MLKVYRDLDLPSKHNGRPIGLDVRYIQPHQGHLPVIIFTHGFKAFKDWGPFNLMADRWARKGFCVVKVNLSHNGATEEHPTELFDLEAFADNTLTIELDDLETVIEHVAKKEFLQKMCGLEGIGNVYLVGHSRGGGLSLFAASELEESVQGIVTWAAITRFEMLWKPEELLYWKEKGEIKIWHERTQQDLPMRYTIVEDFYANVHRVDPVKLKEKTKKPVYVIHARDDERIPFVEANFIKECFPQAEVEFLETGGHLFEVNHPWDQDSVSQVFAEVVEKTATFLQKLEK